MLDFNYTVKRTNRKKTASVAVKEDAVMVTVPSGLTDKEIETIIHKKRRWIREKLYLNLKINEAHKPKEYVSGEAFSYLGRNYRMKIVDSDEKRVSLKNGYFQIPISTNIPLEKKEKLIKQKLVDWYKEHALKRLKEKSSRYAKQIGVTPRNIHVKDYRSRWGGCSHAGEVTFNWHIIMAPNRIVDYVVAHELCHLVHHNHSAKYWKLLSSVFPDWRECKEWLKLHGKGLSM